MNIIPKDFTLHALLHNPYEQFRVPAYQRRYAWGPNQQAALFKDIDMLLPSDGHLFGMLILHSESHQGGINNVGVVDGQQRLTSISILLYALQKKFKDLGDKYTAQQIAQLLYCGNPEKSKDLKLVLGELDNPDYVQLFNGKPNNIVNKNLLSAYQVFNDFIKEGIDKDGNTWLSTYYNKLVHTAKIIRLDVQQAQDAYKLFETINNRGLRLSATDILKNFILGHAAKISLDKLQVVKDLWAELIVALDGIPSDDFFRQYVSSLYTRKISSAKLIDEFKKHYFKNVLGVEKLGEYRYNYGIDDLSSEYDEEDEEIEMKEDVANHSEENGNHNRIDITNYIQDIVNAALCYAKIWHRKFADPKLNQRVADLQSIRSFPSYIFLMHYLQKDLPKKEKYKVLDMIAVIMLRRHMTGKSTAYNDDIFANLLRLDFEEGYIENIRARLLEDYPEDDEFEDRFPVHELKQRVISRARYILSKIEYEKTGNTNEYSINSPEDVHIEHIIPQTINTKSSKKEYGDWEAYLGDKAKLNHKKFVNTIGNLTLLASDLNISASNNPFTKKKNSYRSSNILLTQELAEYRDFKFYHLDKRGKELAELAVKIWNL